MIIQKEKELIIVCLKIWVTLGGNYADYMTTEPINCNEELQRVANADYELCTALLTAILREDHFSNGSFEHRQRAGQVDEILKRMVTELNK